MWSTINPRFGLRPDWCRSGARGLWPAGFAALFAIGLGGSIALLAVSLAAGRVGFENTLADDLLELPVIEQFILVALLAPLLEEFLFRLPLAGKLRIGMLAAVGAVGLFSFLVGPYLGSLPEADEAVSTVGFLDFALGLEAVLFVAVLFGAVLVVPGVLWIQSLIVSVGGGGREDDAAPARRQWRDVAAGWWETHPRWPIWSAIAAFGLVHLSNYDVNWSVAAVAVVPLVVSPQLWLGLMFTIARVRYGWWAGLVLHAVHNLSVWGVSSLLSELEAT
ncbi:hypothetical protein [Candidatus Poriferisodalis sp.]|uniref:hypothetical protein n=1 Tax=Candidatus Poriferisodalis sp. TaxID=3101277 RepID=UPI003B02149B